MKVFCFLLICGLGLLSSACGKKPAYANINTSRQVATANENSAPPVPESTDRPVGAPMGPPAGLPTAPADPPAANQQASSQIKMPKFVVNGQAKDLPNYPNGSVAGFQYGPMGELEFMSLSLQTRDPIEKIVAYYDKAIKANGWSVDARTVDSESAEWFLKKVFDNEGRIQVKKDPRTGVMIILVVRTGKQGEPEKQP